MIISFALSMGFIPGFKLFQRWYRNHSFEKMSQAQRLEVLRKLETDVQLEERKFKQARLQYKAAKRIAMRYRKRVIRQKF